MSWHYRPAVETVDDEQRWTVREYFQLDDGVGWTAPIAAHGETKAELIECLERMLADVKRRPVIDLTKKEEA